MISKVSFDKVCPARSLEMLTLASLILLPKNFNSGCAVAIVVGRSGPTSLCHIQLLETVHVRIDKSLVVQAKLGFNLSACVCVCSLHTLF